MPRAPLLTRSFALICATTLAFFTSMTMVQPVFPAFLRARIGASEAIIGMFIGLFSVTGVLLRPVVGRALATRSRRSFMMLGGATTALCSALYLGPRTLWFLVPVRLLHGLAIASYYTSASTLVADAAPEERRGEALSYFSMVLYVGLAGGGAVGLALEDRYNAVFGVAAAMGALCVVLARAVAEPRAHSDAAREVERHPLINRRALFPGAVLSLGAVGYAALLNFSADFAAERGIEGRALFFPVLAASVIAVRFFGGALSDRLGRLVVAGPGLGIFGAGLIVLSTADGAGRLLLAAALCGSGFGLFFPTMMAFTIDRVRAVERPSAMGTFTASFDAGFGAGSLALGAIHGASDYPTMYRASVGFVGAGVLLLAVGARHSGARAGATSSDGAASASS